MSSSILSLHFFDKLTSIGPEFWFV